MGMNTTVIIMNDALGEIEKDPDFGKNLARAIKCWGSLPLDVPAGHHCNAATVVEQHHCSFTVIVAVGGNYATVLGSVVGDDHNKPEKQNQMLKSIMKKYSSPKKD